MTRTERVADDVPQVGRAPRARIPRVAYLVGVLGVLWFLFGAVGGSYQGKLASVQKKTTRRTYRTRRSRPRSTTRPRTFGRSKAFPASWSTSGPGG